MPPASIPTSCKSGEVDLGMEEVGGVEELATLESARRRSGVCRWRRLQYEAASASFLPMGGRFDERAARPLLLFTDLLVYILVNSDELMNQGIQIAMPNILSSFDDATSFFNFKVRYASLYKNDLDFYFMESWKSCIPGSAVTEG
uniref:Uncharacterized protein n=1 Tax=Oryza meridionalis TaxID=40149 RepID=A0A0E0EZG7_9ORYZ